MSSYATSPTPRPRWTPENTQELLLYFSKGHPAHVIADIIGRTPAATRAYLLRLKYQQHPDYPQAQAKRLQARQLAPEELERLQHMVNDGLSAYQISQHLRLPTSTVWSRLKRYGIHNNKPYDQNFANFLSSSWRSA